MRKTLNVVLAVVLALTMIGGMAYVVTPERTSEYQISLVSAKAVTVQDATQGIRSYSDLVDTTKGFQVNEIINVAITAEVKNLEKPASNNKYKSIADKDIKVVVGSPSIDFNVARLNSPTLLTHVWSGYTGQNVATVGYVMHAGEVLKYDKATNEISWTFRGRNQYAMNASSTVGYNLVTFDPKLDGGKIVIPAIKLQDKKDKWTLGSWSYDVTHEAPESIAYTMVLTGVTMDNAGAATGEFYAKIEVTGAEKFVDETKYYVDYNGKAYDNVPTYAQIGSLRSGATAPLEWLDYVEIDVDKLEIAGGYNVYRYDVPASAVLADIPIIYGGEYDDFNGPDKNNEIWTDGKVIASVQPQLWDYATKKDNSTTANVAGGVKSMKAYDYYQDGSKSPAPLWTKTSDYPLTSVVYGVDKAYYAPGFYGGLQTTGRPGPDEVYSSKPVDGTAGYGKNANTTTQVVVDYFYVDLPMSVVENANFLDSIQVWKADQVVAPAHDNPWTDIDVNAITSVPPNSMVPAGTNWTPTATPAGTLTGVATTPAQWESADPSTYIGLFSKYGTGGGIIAPDYSVPQNGTNNGVVTVSNRLTEKVDYSSTWTKNTDGTARVIVKPLDDGTNHTYPLEAGGGTAGNQWVVFYRNMQAPADKQLMYMSTVSRLSHPTQKQYSGSGWVQGSAFRLPGIIPVDVGPTPYGSGIVDGTIAAPIYEGLDNSIFEGTATMNEIEAAYDARYPHTGTNADAVTAGVGGTLHEITNVFNSALASRTKVWPVMTEVHKEIPVNVGTGTQPALTVGPLYDANMNPDKTYDLFPLEYASQITNVRFFESDAAATAGMDSTHAAYVKDWDGKVANLPITAPTWIAGTITPGDVVFTSVDVYVEDGKSYAVLSGAWVYDVIDGWQRAKSSHEVYVSDLVVFTMNKGKVDGKIGYNGNYAAPTSIWDIEGVVESNRHIKYHNGITVYTITANSNDRPWISMATENAQFNSDDGYGIALFDGYNEANLAKRILRSNDSNMTYNDGTAGHVNESASMIAAQKYFGLDTSYGTTFLVKDGTFENKGAAAVYSENVTGSFKYGDLVIIGENVEEETVEETIDDTDTDDVDVDDTDDIDTDEIDDTDDTDDTDDAPAQVAPPTGDGSANVAIALAAAAIVAAAGLAFVMKKVR